MLKSYLFISKDCMLFVSCRGKFKGFQKIFRKPVAISARFEYNKNESSARCALRCAPLTLFIQRSFAMYGTETLLIQVRFTMCGTETLFSGPRCKPGAFHFVNEVRK